MPLRSVSGRRRIVVAAVLVLAGCGGSAATVGPTTIGGAVGTVPETAAATSGTASHPSSAPAAASAAASAAATSTSATARRIDGPAVATTEAHRRLDVELGATCDLALVQALAARHPGVDQFVTVAADSWSATSARLELAGFDGTRWVCQTGAKTAMVGANGTRPLVDRRSGDDTAPAGVFPLGTQTAWDGQQFQFFGNSPDPGVRGTYRAVQPADCWGATPGAATYQRLYERANCPGPDDEWLPRYGDVYSHAAVIGANLTDVSGDAPGEPAYAAAIFLHRHNYAGGTQPRPTSGCVSLVAADLVAVLRSIDPELNTHFAIGERTWLATTA
jgi:L,D-peptidoglycan transpeptidase YkuD (ErfK/YbiS/YcfS/YnhG family)